MGSLESIENIIKEKFPVEFTQFMVLNGGLSHYERIFTDKDKTLWEVQSYLNYSELYNLTKEFFEVYQRKLVPFAYDLGNWHFCLCMDEKDFGCIIVNRWTDYPKEEQFLKIANSFEEFIDGLQAEE